MDTITEAYEFFYRHAGFSYNAAQGETAEQGHQVCAMQLALAEAQGKIEGLTFEWQEDAHADLSWMDEDVLAQEHHVEWCGVSGDNSLYLASLGGIIDADRDYRRVIEAELAAEALEVLKQREAAGKWNSLPYDQRR